MSSDGHLPSDSGLGLTYERPSSRALEDDLLIDADDEDESTVNDEEPGTPPGEGVTTPPPHISSPSIPSPMSWGKLDLFTPLGQHLAASLARSPEKSPVVSLSGTHSESEGEVLDHDLPNTSPAEKEPTTSSRDLLVQRLTQLARKISSGEDVADEATLSALHDQLDNMDRTVSEERPHPSSRSHQPSLATGTRGAEPDRPSPWSSPSTSWMRSRYSDLSVATYRDSQQEHTTTAMVKPAVDSFKIASEAAKLNAELDTLVSNLKARQEESEHIHELLVTRAERAAQRIIFLQSRVHLLESELRESDEDLSYLRLGLKAIEVQCPRDMLARDTELARSIANWKHDYADLKKQRTARRRRALGDDSPRTADGGQSLMLADSSVYSESADGDQSNALSTPSRPPPSGGSSYVSSNRDSIIFETPSPRDSRIRRADANSHLATPEYFHTMPSDDLYENEETLTPTSARSQATAASTRDSPRVRGPQRPLSSTTSSKALRRIIMSATPPRKPRLVSLASFGPPLDGDPDHARAAQQQQQHHLRSYESLR